MLERSERADPKLACLVLALPVLVYSSDALAHSAAGSAEDPNRESVQEISRLDKDPIRGSSFIFEQSMSTQAAHIEPSPQQSYVPFYGWWLSLRPRWNFSEKLRLQGRLDYYKELTNSQNTTLYREDVFGDVWTDLVYATRLRETGRWSHTKVTLAARALWPTSKQSQGSGTYVTLGGLAGASQRIPIYGDAAKWLNAVQLGLTVAYLHPFSSATTPTNYGNFAYVRQDVEGFSFVSDQLTGQTLANHQLYAILEAGLQITPKLDFSVSLVWVNQWHYLPPPTTVATLTGTATVPRIDDQQFTQLIWDVAALDYALFDELSLGVGYYNLTNAVAADGRLRSPFSGGQTNALWSPDARVFVDLTVNIDRLLEDVTGRYRSNARREVAMSP